MTFIFPWALVDSLNAEKIDLAFKIHKIESTEKKINKKIGKYNENRESSVPLLKNGYRKLYDGVDDATEGSMRTRFEEICVFEENVLAVIDDNMQKDCDLFKKIIDQMEVKKAEYQQRINAIGNELADIDDQKRKAERSAEKNVKH